MEHIKEAFYKVKQDMESLKKEISLLNKGLFDTRENLIEICEVLKRLSKKSEEKIEEKKEEKPIKNISIEEKQYPTHIENIPTHINPNTTHPKPLPAHNMLYNPLKGQNMNISTGNRGVPTDRQTDQQTDKGSYNNKINKTDTNNSNNNNQFPQSDSINNAAQILDSLDNLKKEIRLKFKRLTEQEFLVFSTIYQLSEEVGYTDYKNLSEKLNLTESSIRDYIGRLIKKGIPVDKTKINNKTIHLSISSNLKKIASLPTILQLRAI
jgi:hypothetical protein